MPFVQSAAGSPALLVNQTGAAVSTSVNKLVFAGGTYYMTVSIAQTGTIIARAQQTVDVSWYTDNTYTTKITAEVYVFYAGSNSATDFHVVNITGPTESPYCIVTLTQTGTAWTAAAGNTIQIMDTNTFRSRHLGFSRVTPVSYNSSAPTTGASVARLILVNQQVNSIPANGQGVNILPLYSGKASLGVQTTSNAQDASLAVVETLTGAGTAALFANTFSVHGRGDVMTEVALPRTQCDMFTINNNAAVQNLICLITADADL